MSLHVCAVYCIIDIMYIPFLAFSLDVLRALDHQLDVQWKEFGTFLLVKPDIMAEISKETSNVNSCMLQLVNKWLYHEDRTGDLPRTWKTVVQAVKDTGKGLLAEQLAERYGVQLSGQ